MVLRALLVMALATGLLHLARVGLGLANVATDPPVPWSRGYLAWQVVPMSLFGALLPALLVLGIVGVWKRKPGAARVALLSAAALITLGGVELGYGLIQFFRTPQPPIQLGESLVMLVQSFLANQGLLILLVIALRRSDGAPVAAEP